MEASGCRWQPSFGDDHTGEASARNWIDDRAGGTTARSSAVLAERPLLAGTTRTDVIGQG